jgi:N-acetyl-alpha-D-muramate 1-phosphate uridylyltransferase
MKALILSAGRGERMRPLTDDTPKPLLRAGNRALIEYHLDGLAQAGIRDIVINLSYLGAQIRTELGDGRIYGVRIVYSDEGPRALETGGGIFNALPLLGTDPFLVVNGDIWTDYPYNELPTQPAGLAHLVMVSNPTHHPHGDFVLEHGKLYDKPEDTRLTFSGIGVYQPALFAACNAGSFPLAPLLRRAMANEQISGEHYRGEWLDIGTPARLAELDRLLLERL